MSFELNHPGFSGPDGQPIGPHSFSSGVEYEKTLKLMEGVLKGLRLKPTQETDYARLLQGFRAKVTPIKAFVAEVNSQAGFINIEQDNKFMGEQVTSRYMDAMIDYSKDELMAIMSFYFTTWTLNEQS